MDSIRFYVKRPDKVSKANKSRKGKRKSFAVYQRTLKNQKVVGDSIVKDQVIDSINGRYLSGSLGRVEAEKAIKDFVIKLKKKHGLLQKLVFNSDNKRILKQFWDKEYSTRDIVDENTAYCDFRRAVEAVGEKSLQTSSQTTLEKEIKKKHRGEKQRRIASRLNQILKFLKRDIVLRKDRPEKRKVQHLTLEEFKKVLSCIEDIHLKTLCEVCFYSGMRVGEAFGVEKSGISDGYVRVHQQLDKEGYLRDTKNRKERTAFVFDEGMRPLKKWVVSREEFLLSRTNINKRFRRACEKAFPENREKHCKFHDLRHSYAVRLLSKGVSMSLIAQSLGNSIAVCEKYYTGYVMTFESIVLIKKAVGETDE